MRDQPAPTTLNWRMMFGSTALWLPPKVEKPPENGAAAERCELCREPIDIGQHVLTNSAGQRPTHALPLP